MLSLLAVTAVFSSCGKYKKTEEPEPAVVTVDGREYELKKYAEQFKEVKWRYPKEFEKGSCSYPDSCRNGNRNEVFSAVSDIVQKEING